MGLASIFFKNAFIKCRWPEIPGKDLNSGKNCSYSKYNHSMKDIPVPESRSSIKKWFWLLLALNLMFIVVAVSLLRPVTFGVVVSLEFAGNKEKATALISEWSNIPGMLDKAVLSVYLDFGFIVLYISFLVTACLYLPAFSGFDLFINAGKFFAWLLIVVVFCEVRENFGLLRILGGDLETGNIEITHHMAVTKFT